MKRTSLLRLALLLIFLLIAMSWFGGTFLRFGQASSGIASDSVDQGGPENASSGTDYAPAFSSKRRDPAATAAGVDWSNLGERIDGEKRDVTRSRVRAIVPAGHSMVTGGHLLPDGSREFALITPKWIDLPSGSRMVEMKVEMLHFDPASIAGVGLETLVTGERKSEQNAEVWTPEEVARTMGSERGGSVQAMPKVVTTPNSPGLVRMGAGRKVQFELELSASEAADGGFVLVSDLMRAD
jgi:hypothetical protein